MNSFKQAGKQHQRQIEIQYELQELFIKNSKKIYNENKKCFYTDNCNVKPCGSKTCPYVDINRGETAPHAEGLNPHAECNEAPTQLQARFN
jgi:hypothetical protein